MSKIVTHQQLLQQRAEARAQGLCVVHCHGCFDIVHPGHIRYLEFAKRQGDLLVVSLTGDSQVSKAPQRPYIPEELRAENLAALQAVDLVYIDPHPTASNLLADLQPDVYVKGREYETSGDSRFHTEKEIVASYGGRIMFSSGDVVFSSTRLIEAMNQDPALDLERMSLLCRRHGITRQLIERVCLGFSQQRVLIVGDTLLDEYVMCDAVDLASEAPMMSLKELERRLYIGGAGVLARHALNLGAEVYLLSAGTRDNSEQTVINELDTTRLHTHFEPSRPALPCKTRFLVETSKVMRLERGDCCPLDSVAESHACEWVETIADNIDAVIFCDYGYGMLTGGLIERLLDRLRPSVRIMTANSSGPRGRLLEFKGCDLLCPTERMLRSALHDFDSGLSSAAWDALQQTQARQLMVSLGKKGMVAFERPSQDETSAEWRGRLRSEHLPALSEHPLDSLGMDGASQVVASLALASGASLMQAGYLAGAASAVASSQLGNDPITSEQLRRWLGMRMELTHSSRRPPQEPCRFAHERGPETPGRFDQPVRQNPINLPADQTS